MGPKTVIELIHIAAGLAAAMLIAALSTWSYPRAESDIWLVAYFCMAAIVAMAVGPVRRAMAADRAEAERGSNG